MLNTFCASSDLSGFQRSSIVITAISVPSGCIRAKRLPDFNVSDFSAGMSRTIGIGHSVPLDSRISSRTLS